MSIGNFFRGNTVIDWIKEYKLYWRNRLGPYVVGL